MVIEFQCSKAHGMASGSSSSGDSCCSLCLTAIAAIYSTKDSTDPAACVACSSCNFSICSNCCTLVVQEQTENSTREADATNTALVLEDPQSLCQQAYNLVSLRTTTPTPDEEQAAFETAMTLYHQALSTRHYILGASHPAVAATHRSVAKAFMGKRHYVAAMDAYQAALRAYTTDNQQHQNRSHQDQIDRLEQEITQLLDTMVDAANYYMMQGMELQARHVTTAIKGGEALQQFEYAHSLLASVASLVAISSKDNNGTNNNTNNSLPSLLELSLSLGDVCRVIASSHVSANNYAPALPFLQQAHSLVVGQLGQADPRAMALASDVATLQALMEKQKQQQHSHTNNNTSVLPEQHNQYDAGDQTQVPHWFERDDFDNNENNTTQQDTSTGLAKEIVVAEESQASTASAPSRDKPLGISIDWLKRGFWREIKAAKLDPNATMQQVIDKVIQPKKKNTIDTSVYLDDIDGACTGPASVMVSHAKESTIGDIINTLDDYCRTKGYSDKDVHVWVACLCQPSSSQPATTEGELKTLTTTIGHVLAILSPWYAPLAWKNPSCLWEIYLAHQLAGCKLTLVLPPAQTVALADAFVGDPSLPVANLYNSLDALQVESMAREVTKDEVYHRLQEIFRPWVRNVLKSQVQEHCNNDDDANVSPPTATIDNSDPLSQPASRAAGGETATDVFKLQLCSKMGLLFWHYGEFKAALELLEDALSMTEAMYGEQHESTATVYQNIADVLSDMGRYGLALETYHKGLSMLEVGLPEYHPKIADICTNLGNVYRITASLDKAMEFHQRALTIHVKLNGSQNSLASADSCNDMGNVFYSKGDNDAAVMEFRKALGIQESILDDKAHSSLATTHGYIGKALKRKGNRDGALQEYHAALSIQEETLGQDHLETAMTYENLASLMRSQDELHGALEMCEKAKVVYQNAFGMYHPSTATALQMLGTIQNDMDNVEDALQSYRAALDIREAVLGKEHLSAAETLRSIGILLFEIGDLDAALVELRRAFDIMEPVLGIEHPATKKLADTINTVLEA